MPCIHLIDDDGESIEQLEPVFAREGYEVIGTPPGPNAIRLALVEQPDLLIVGFQPHERGWQFLRRLVALIDQPVLLLMSASDERERARCLDLGADDYLVRPFSLVELLARVRVLLRRNEEAATLRRHNLFVDEGLRVDLSRREVRIEGRPVRLTPTEFRVLSCLVRNAGEVLSHERLLSQAWGSGYETSTELLKQHIHHLRRKLEPDPSHPCRIVTRWGQGYLFQFIGETGDPEIRK